MNALLTAPRLVVSQRAKLVELTNQYTIHDVDGRELGHITEELQSKARKALRFVSDIDQFLTHRLSLYDAEGNKIVALTRPAKLFKSRLLVEDGAGRQVGTVVQQNVFGKIRFRLLGAQGEQLGEIRAENWRAWDFSIVDATEMEVARIDKKFVGIAKAMFTNADNYVVDIDPDVLGDLRLLILAAATAVDTALKQDSRGLDVVDVFDLT